MDLLDINNYDKEIDIRKQIEMSKKNKSWKKKRLKIREYVLKNPLKKRKKKKRKERKRKIIRSYKTYISSDLWKNRKNRYFKKYGRVCEICKSHEYVTLHHSIYRQNYGREPDEEVFAFCRACHEEFHKRYGVKRDMINITNQYISERKREIKMTEELSEIENRFNLISREI